MIKKNKMEKGKDNDCGLATLLGFAGGILMGGIAHMLTVSKNMVSSVDIQDINRDGLKDVVVELNSGKKKIFYNNGKEYLLNWQMKERDIKKIKESYLNQLKETNEFYKRIYGEPNEIQGEK